MNKKKALLQGLRFTGVYNYNKEDTMARKKDYKGYRVVTVDMDCGYSLYAEKRYFVDEDILSLQKKIAGYDKCVEFLYKQYEKDRMKMLEEKQHWKKQLTELQNYDYEVKQNE